MPYGAAAEFWKAKDHEVILSGPYETGKTLVALHKANAMSCKYAGSRGLMIRRTYNSLIQSACVTFEQKVLHRPPGHPECPVQKIGGSKPTHYEYPNGSIIVLGGMDNASKFLSSEWDWIYVNQAEELELDTWAMLTSRATGRAENMPYAIVFGDCNPGPPSHWIRHRETLRVIEARHEDNPTLFDQVRQCWTDRGKITLAILDALPGVRRLRGRYGKWVAAEGQVYEGFDAAVHVIDPFEIPSSWSRYWAVDFGFTHPFVWQEWAADGDGRLYLLREIYMTGQLVEDHAARILELTEGLPPPQAIICDHDAEDRATLERHLRLRTRKAYKAIKPGIEAVQSRLRYRPEAPEGDPRRRPRLFMFSDALDSIDPELLEAKHPYSTPQEIEVYVYPRGADGRPSKDVPIDAFNHGLDAMRYVVAFVDRIDLNTSVSTKPAAPAANKRNRTITGGIRGARL